MDLTSEVIKALREKGYEMPDEALRGDARAKFVADYGYDPAILKIQTIRLADSCPDWRERIVPAPKPRKKKAAKKKA